MSPADSDTMRTELRDTIHKLNNLLTTLLVQGEAVLLAKPGGDIEVRATRIVEAAEEAESVLRACRTRILEPEPDLEATFPPAD